MYRLLVLLLIFGLSYSCGTSRNFNAQKFTTLKKIKPSKTELQNSDTKSGEEISNIPENQEFPKTTDDENVITDHSNDLANEIQSVDHIEIQEVKEVQHHEPDFYTYEANQEANDSLTRPKEEINDKSKKLNNNEKKVMTAVIYLIITFILVALALNILGWWVILPVLVGMNVGWVVAFGILGFAFFVGSYVYIVDYTNKSKLRLVYRIIYTFLKILYIGLKWLAIGSALALGIAIVVLLIYGIIVLIIELIAQGVIAIFLKLLIGAAVSFGVMVLIACLAYLIDRNIEKSPFGMRFGWMLIAIGFLMMAASVSFIFGALDWALFFLILAGIATTLFFLFLFVWKLFEWLSTKINV